MVLPRTGVPAVQRHYTTSGTATEGVDFEAARGVVTFEPWQESAKGRSPSSTMTRRGR